MHASSVDCRLARWLTATLLAVFSACSSAEEPPSGLEYARWSGTLNVPDPVAISFDNHGRAYVTQTQRRKANDLDIRANRDWVAQDVGLQSVADKLQFYHERLAPDMHQERNRGRVKDLNGDGSHDYRDLMVLTERILRLEDTDRDGVADAIDLFADGFQTEVTGIAAGVLAHEGRVYTTIAPDVWVLEDSDADGKADRREVLASGFGVHIAYAGHDMHGLTVGPDGRIYWSIGDKGISVTDRNGRLWSYPNEGGVMRCFPDGSEFEVFAHGLRNVQELAFDQYGNLFGVDNDADQPNERERFVSIVRGMDAGWRCHYQYRGDAWNPWTDERLWQTWFDEQAAYIIPPIRHSINGPAGFAFNPGTALSPSYRDYFFLTGAPNGQQIAFQVRPRGASFEMANVHDIGSGIPLVGINFGPDGALYGVDWGGGYPLNQTGAVWKIDDPEFAESDVRREVSQLLRDDFEKRTDQELAQLLRHPDQRVRLKAQFALVRGGVDHELVGAAEDPAEPLLARIHAIWGLGQRARQDAVGVQCLTGLLSSDDPDLLIQVARTIGDLPEFDGGLLIPLLEHSDPRVRLQTLLALQAHPTTAAVPQILASASRLSPEEVYLRHAVSFALSTCAESTELAKYRQHAQPIVRLICALGLRHQRAAEVAVYLQDSDVRVRNAAARAIHDDGSLPEALPALAALVEHPDVTGSVVLRRAINAGYLLGDPASAMRLLRCAARTDLSAAVRIEAIQAVADWMRPAPLDRVTGEPRDADATARALDRQALQPLLTPLLRSEEPAIQAAALAAHSSLAINVEESAVAEIVRDSDSAAELVVAALNALDTQRSERLIDVLPHAAASAAPEVAVRALELAVELQATEATHLLRAGWASQRPAVVRQRAVALLPRLMSAEADTMILQELQKAMAAPDRSSIALELQQAASERAGVNAEIREALMQWQARLAAAGAQSVGGEYQVCLTGGDPVNGRRLFNTHLQAQCVRCHRVGREGSTVGPRLDDVGLKRTPEYLLRSIVYPNADIEDPYRSEVIVLTSGLTVMGVRIRESPDTLVVANREGKEVEIARDEIEQRSEQKVSIMPDVRKVLTRREIRDLLAYLKTLRRRAQP